MVDSEVAKSYRIAPSKKVIITTGYPTGSVTTKMMKVFEVI